MNPGVSGRPSARWSDTVMPVLTMAMACVRPVCSCPLLSISRWQGLWPGSCLYLFSLGSDLLPCMSSTNIHAQDAFKESVAIAAAWQYDITVNLLLDSPLPTGQWQPIRISLSKMISPWLLRCKPIDTNAHDHCRHCLEVASWALSRFQT